MAFAVHLLLLGAVGGVVGCVTVLFERLSGQAQRSSSWWTGVANAFAIVSVGMLVDLSDSIGIGGLLALAVFAQFVVVAWQQRLRESRIYRVTARDADSMPGSLDPTATPQEARR